MEFFDRTVLLFGRQVCTARYPFLTQTPIPSGFSRMRSATCLPLYKGGH